MPKIINGIIIAKNLTDRLTLKAKKLEKQPSMAVVYVGKNPVSLSYIKAKEKAAKEIGIKFLFHNLPASSSEINIINLIQKLNTNRNINAIIVQLPLPKKISRENILNTVAKEKDVDGLSQISKNYKNKFISPTAQAIMEIIKSTKINLKQSSVVLIGHGILVGQPLAKLLKNKVKKLIICDKQTKNIPIQTKKADILISAIGVPNFIKANMVKKGAVVIDAGTAEFEGKIKGDVDFQKVAPLSSHITPVPGGVGPLTVAMLFSNVLKAVK